MPTGKWKPTKAHWRYTALTSEKGWLTGAWINSDIGYILHYRDYNANKKWITICGSIGSVLYWTGNRGVRCKRCCQLLGITYGEGIPCFNKQDVGLAISQLGGTDESEPG